MAKFVYRLIFPPKASDLASRVETATKQADEVTTKLNSLANTKSPYTGDRDPLAALVHEMRGTIQRRSRAG